MIFCGSAIFWLARRSGVSETDGESLFIFFLPYFQDGWMVAKTGGAAVYADIMEANLTHSARLWAATSILRTCIAAVRCGWAWCLATAVEYFRGFFFFLHILSPSFHPNHQINEWALVFVFMYRMEKRKGEGEGKLPVAREWGYYLEWVYLNLCIDRWSMKGRIINREVSVNWVNFHIYSPMKNINAEERSSPNLLNEKCIWDFADMRIYQIMANEIHQYDARNKWTCRQDKLYIRN